MSDEFGIEKTYFTIREVSERLGVNPSVLRFWETEFKEVAPRKSRSGRRQYTQGDVKLLERIHQLVKVEKYTLEGARAALTQPAPNEPMPQQPTPPAGPQSEVLTRLKQVQARLVELRNRL